MSSYYLPPTSNVLDQEQRTRLIKSTRKLEAVLGTTPRLLDSSDAGRSSLDSYPSRSSSRASHRSARIYGSWSDNASVLSFSSGSSSSSSSSPSDLNSDTDSLTSPESSPTTNFQPHLQMCADLPPSPPPLSAPSHHPAKPKKTFEPTLFLRLHNLPPQHQTCLDITRQKVEEDDSSIATAIPHRHHVPPSPLSPISPVPDTPRVRNMLDQRRKRMAKLTRTLGENVPPELVFGGSGDSDQDTPKKRKTNVSYRPRRASLDDWTIVHTTNDTAETPRTIRASSKVYNSITVSVPGSVGKYYPDDDTFTKFKKSGGGGALRRGASTRVNGKGWSGEWNHEMDDVVNRLRNLK